ATYTMTAGYDANSRLVSVAYPSGFTARYGYNGLGYANQLKDNVTGQVYWTAGAMDAEQHLKSFASGNGIVTTRSFDAQTGRLTAIVAGPNNAVQSVGYTYDRLGNPLSRTDNAAGVSETFGYDALNRLTTAAVAQNTAPAKSFAYDAVGNILAKSD